MAGSNPSLFPSQGGMELGHPSVWNIDSLPPALPGVPGQGGTLLSCSAGQGVGLPGRDCFLQPSVLGGT